MHDFPVCLFNPAFRSCQNPIKRFVCTTTTTTTHPFNGLFCRTTWVSWYQKSKISLDSNEARDYGVLLQTDNNINTSSLNFYMPDALPDAQPTMSKHSLCSITISTWYADCSHEEARDKDKELFKSMHAVKCHL